MTCRGYHQELTNHFANWYNVPSDLHLVAQRTYSGQLWQSLLDGTPLDIGGPESFRVHEFSTACRYKALPTFDLLFGRLLCSL